MTTASQPSTALRLPIRNRFADILARCQQAPDAPFRGISSYRLLDAGVLFARDDQIERLAELIVVYRGALVFGESGVGKSSLINAGFVPEMLRLGYLPERVRVRNDPATPIVVERIALDPGGRGELLTSNFANDTHGGTSLSLSLDEFRTRLSGLSSEHGALLVFDQFEEIITLFEDAPAPDQLQRALELQRQLYDLLGHLLTSKSIAVKCVFSLREDYLGRLAPFIGMVPDLRERVVHVQPMRAAQLGEIVSGPIEKFKTKYGDRMPEKTVAELIRRFQARVGAGPLNLSELQIVCRSVWDDPAQASLLGALGIPAIIDQYFARQFAQSAPDEQTAMKALMSCMVTSSGTRNWVSVDDLTSRVGSDTGVPREQLARLLDVLDHEPRRLLASEERQNVVYYTILTEFLVPRIRVWQQERRELDARRLQLDAAKKTRQRTSIVFLLLALVVLVLAVLEQRRDKREALLRADTKAAEASAKADSLSLARAASDRFSAQATSASLHADSITRMLQATAESVRREATSGSRRTADLEKQLASTRRELQRVLSSTAAVTKLSDSVRSTSSSAVESLSRQNSLLRDQLAQVNAIAASLRRLRAQVAKSDPSLASRIDSLAAQLVRISRQQQQSYAK